MSIPVVVTGASGLLGGNLATALIDAGYRVRGIRRRTSNVGHLVHLPIEWCESDLSTIAAAERALTGASAVFHCAAETAQSRWLRPEHRAANIVAAENVLAACTAMRVDRLIHCSTTITCGLSVDGAPVSEESEAQSRVRSFGDGYQISKRIAEDTVLSAASNVDVVVVNPGHMFGPLDAKPSSGRLILYVAKGMAPCWTAGRNNFVDSRDVARGMVAALENGRRGERYILGGENLSYREVLNLIAERLGSAPPRFPLRYGCARIAGWIGDAIERITGRALDINTSTVRYAYCDGVTFSSEKALREIGYRPGPVRQGIDAAIVWFRENGFLR